MPLGRLVVRAVVGAIGVRLGLRLAPATRGFLGPVEVSARLDAGVDGGTRVDVAPLGSVRLATHRGPLSIEARAMDVDPSRADGLLRMPDGPADRAALDTQLDAARAGLIADARALAATLARRSALAGAGGAAALATLALRRPADVVGATASGLALLAAGAGVAAATRNGDAIRDPQLTGLLTRAPLMLGDLQAVPENVSRYRDQLADLVRTGTAVHRRIVDLPEPPPSDAIRLVHISDIHLSPLAFALAATLVEQYAADAVIDTGDLVDWGTPAEQLTATQIADLVVPYVYVKGNHDSAGIVAAVARQPNAVVASSEPQQVAGLTVVGMPDPRFTPDKTTGDDRARDKVSVAARAFAQGLSAADVHADLALVHAPAAGRALEGVVPLVLAGDIHRRTVQRYGDTVVLTQGSTGGSGLRGVQHDPPVPLMLSVLFLDRTTRRLWGADEVTLDGLGGTGLQIARRTAAHLVGTP